MLGLKGCRPRIISDYGSQDSFSSIFNMLWFRCDGCCSRFLPPQNQRLQQRHRHRWSTDVQTDGTFYRWKGGRMDH